MEIIAGDVGSAKGFVNQGALLCLKINSAPLGMYYLLLLIPTSVMPVVFVEVCALILLLRSINMLRIERLGPINLRLLNSQGGNLYG